MKFYKVDKHDFHQVSKDTANKLIHADDMTLAIWKINKGNDLALHSHPHKQISCVFSGKMEFHLEGGKKVLAGQGDVIVFDSNEAHAGCAIEDSLIYDFFTPSRDDFKEKFPSLIAE